MRRWTAGPVERGRQRLRWPVLATVLLFVANGAIFGAIVPRLPELKDTLGLGAAHFGLAMACYPVGALLGSLTAPTLFRHRSDGTVAVVTMIGACTAAGSLALSPGVAVFAAVLVAFGVCDSVTDVAMNAHGIRVQLRAGRSLMNRFHASWSLGAVVGAVLGSVAAGLGASVRTQMAAIAGVCVLSAVVAAPMRLAGRVPDPVVGAGRSRRATWRAGSPRVWGAIVGLGLMACCAELVEDFAQTWSALYLREIVGVGAGLAGSGFIAVQGMQMLGRLAGDRMTDAVGTVRVGVVGGICVSIGAGVVFLASFGLSGPALLAVTVPGLALAGWGIATCIPGAMVASDAAEGLPPGLGLSVLNWVMRLGMLVSPPTVGLIAEHAGMRWTVAPMVVAGVLISLLSVRLLVLADRRTGGTDTGGTDTGERAERVHQGGARTS